MSVEVNYLLFHGLRVCPILRSSLFLNCPFSLQTYATSSSLGLFKTKAQVDVISSCLESPHALWVPLYARTFCRIPSHCWVWGNGVLECGVGLWNQLGPRLSPALGIFSSGILGKLDHISPSSKPSHGFPLQFGAGERLLGPKIYLLQVHVPLKPKLHQAQFSWPTLFHKSHQPWWLSYCLVFCLQVLKCSCKLLHSSGLRGAFLLPVTSPTASLDSLILIFKVSGLNLSRFRKDFLDAPSPPFKDLHPSSTLKLPLT